MVVLGLLACLLLVGAILGFPSGWVTASEVGLSSVTLVMVFAIQHTQGREQAASQRKLDELLRALPGARERLMMLEEAPDSVLRDVVDDQREHHDEAVAADARTAEVRPFAVLTGFAVGGECHGDVLPGPLFALFRLGPQRSLVGGGQRRWSQAPGKKMPGPDHIDLGRVDTKLGGQIQK